MLCSALLKHSGEAMESKLSIGGLQARRDAKVNKLASFGPTLQGTLTNVSVTCGNPNCRCARGHKHRSFRVTKKVAGKTKSLYVPVDMLEEVQEWIKQHRQPKKLLQWTTAQHRLPDSTNYHFCGPKPRIPRSHDARRILRRTRCDGAQHHWAWITDHRHEAGLRSRPSQSPLIPRS